MFNVIAKQHGYSQIGKGLLEKSYVDTSSTQISRRHRGSTFRFSLELRPLAERAYLWPATAGSKSSRVRLWTAQVSSAALKALNAQCETTLGFCGMFCLNRPNASGHHRNHQKSIALHPAVWDLGKDESIWSREPRLIKWMRHLKRSIT